MAKTDMERLGVFSEMGYTTIKDPYVSTYAKPFNVSASKNKQFQIESSKSKTAFQDGYFSKKFDRILEGEAYSEMIKLRRQQRAKSNKKNLGGPYVPPSGTKPITGLGGSYGTLSGPIKSFSAATRPGPKYKVPGKNILTNPGKKGTGYGYTSVTIGSLPKYESDPFDRAQVQRKKEQKQSLSKQKDGAFKLNMHPRDYFQENPFHADKSAPPDRDSDSKKERLKPFRPSHPAKLIGGCKAGTFESYPKHSEDQFILPKFGRPGLVKSKMKGGVFKPSQDIKTTPTVSVMQQNVLRKMNISNFRAMAATV